MKSATMVIAVAAPVMVFAFLYFLLVQPERRASVEAQNQLATARGELNRRRASSEPSAAGRARDVADAVKTALNAPAVGGVANLSVATGAPVDGSVEHTPVSITFDARYAQVGRFLWSLREQPALFELQSVELAPQPSPAGLVHAKMSLVVFDRPGASAPAPRPQAVDAGTPPVWTRDPFAREVRAAAAPKRAATPAVLQAGPDPVVTTILFSEGRRVARVDGRIVAPGDPLGPGFVQSIEPEAVVIVEPGGRTRRFEIARPVTANVTR